MPLLWKSVLYFASGAIVLTGVARSDPSGAAAPDQTRAGEMIQPAAAALRRPAEDGSHPPAAAASTAPDAGAAAVIIDTTPAYSHRIMFNRFHKDPGMPATRPGEAALTQSNFECSANVTYTIVQHERVGDHWHVQAKIVKVRVKTSLTDTIYLPQLCPIALRAHEEGHRAMNERVYNEGAPIAKEAAEQLLQGTWPGDGADPDSAGKAATDAAVNAFCQEYLRHTSHRASVLGDVYDKFTSHGRNAMYVAEAIKLSFLEEKKIDATQPATTQVSIGRR